MEAPLPQKEAEPEPEPEKPAVDGASDAKGWTVFMDKPPVQMPTGQMPAGPMGFAKPAEPAQPAAQPAGPQGFQPVPAAAPQPAAHAPIDDVGKGKTMIATASQMQAIQPPAGHVAGQAAPMTFKQPEPPPQDPSTGGSEEGVHVPQTTGAVEKVSAPSTPAMQPQSTAVAQGTSAPIATQEGGNGAKIAIGVAVLAVIGAVVYFLVFA